MAGVLSERGYERLLRDLAGLIGAGRAEAEALAGHVLAVSYWKVGERLLREGLSERAGYGDGVMARLGGELGVSLSTLRRALRFARLYAAPPEPGLGWAHYAELLSVADPELRARYEAKALAEKWSKRALREAISARALSEDGARAEVVDGLSRPLNGDHVFACRVVRVLDADTLIVHVDLGFSVIKEQSVRLAGVDAPEAKTRAGARATQWVQRRLALAEQVVLKTVKSSDVHGRYVGHVFYSGDAGAGAQAVFREGSYLNAELVAEGLALPRRNK